MNKTFFLYVIAVLVFLVGWDWFKNDGRLFHLTGRIAKRSNDAIVQVLPNKTTSRYDISKKYLYKTKGSIRTLSPNELKDDAYMDELLKTGTVVESTSNDDPKESMVDDIKKELPMATELVRPSTADELNKMNEAKRKAEESLRRLENSAQ